MKIKVKNPWIDIEDLYDVREQSSDLKVLKEFYKNRDYVGKRALEFKKGQNWLDLGANIGVFTIAVSRIANEVIAVEASPRNVQVLNKNLILNSCKNVDVIPKAVCPAKHATKNLKFYERRMNDWKSGFFSSKSKDSVEVHVPSIAFESFPQKGWNLKMDIEGAEGILLDHSSFAGFEQIVFEYDFLHNPKFEDFHRRMDRLSETHEIYGRNKLPEKGLWPPSWFPPCTTIVAKKKT